MTSIKTFDGNPLMVDAEGIEDGAVTNQKLSKDVREEILLDSGGEEIALTLITGAYATYNGWNVSNNQFYVTDEIALTAGSIVRIYTQGYLTNVAALSKVGNTQEPNKPYTPIVVADGTAKWYEAVIPEDGNYIVSGLNATTPRLITVKYSFSELDEKIDNLEDAAGVYSQSPTITVGAYASDSGWSVSNNSFYISSAFELNRGDFVRVYAEGYLTNVAILAQITDPDNPSRPYTASIVSDGNTAKWYETVIAENGSYVVSGHKNTNPIITVRKSGDAPKEISYCDFSVFRKFGVIGDSFASGELVFDNQYVDKYSNSWGQILARMCGNTCTNYSAGGLTTRSWLTSDKGLSLMLSSEAEDLYLCALGINDYYHLGLSYLGELTDITSHTSYTDYADTFYGNYGRIIEQVIEHAPHAKLIMLTCASTGSTAMAFNDAIEEIANHYGLPCVVQYEDKFFLSQTYLNMSGGHPRAIGYSGMAVTFKRLIEDAILANVSYFNDLYMYQ